MDCCGCVLPPLSPSGFGLSPGLSRRELFLGMSAAISLALTGCTTIPEQHRVAASELLQEHVSVDLHAHPGMISSSPRSMESHVERMVRGRLTMALFAVVADGPLIGRRPKGGLYATREPRAGELYNATWQQVERVRGRVEKGIVTPVSSPGDVAALSRSRSTGVLFAAEGGDFLEGKVQRVEEAYRRGMRSIQLVHYRVNELGDIQTEPARHGGLTEFGKDVIREM